MRKRTAQSLKSEARPSVNNAIVELDHAATILARACEDPHAIEAVRLELAEVKQRVEALRQKL